MSSQMNLQGSALVGPRWDRRKTAESIGMTAKALVVTLATHAEPFEKSHVAEIAVRRVRPALRMTPGSYDRSAPI